MAPAQLLLVLAASTLILVDEVAAGCQSSNQIECRTGGQCIDQNRVCRSGNQCSDGSDEDPKICKFWTNEDSRCGVSNFYCSGSCYQIYQMCASAQCSQQMDPRVCKLVKTGKLYLEPEGMNLTSSVMQLLETAVNSTLVKKLPYCPMLYTRIGDECFAFFSPAKLPWAESRQFCQSIYGDLLFFNNLTTFDNLLGYMRKALLTTDYWIGGRYDLDTNAWSWVNDDTPMPLGSPYWAERYSSSCVPRSLPHTDPFSSPPAALPGAPCYNYLQAPKERTQGWCSALTYEHYYYISDEICQDTHSPLCILTHDQQ
ncbi:uncharacterized protein LOC121854812 [Homarus americanus]|uniref:Putative C-type lectin-like 23 n=1 Tax=Homarus americanus TaxID=6706 RepID=A0A8J5JG45_HOMAM|nr:uncharacterized protein LOC121854812 [Homarus americanus]KAG7155628.1 putative C-type lectin-like 23 [Homarus americanus]